MIEVRDLSKYFGEFKAINNINFSIKKGEIFGFLGPNGAGKSTTINIMSTILQSNSGTVFIDGINLKEHPSTCKKLIGIVPQEISLYNEFTAYNNLLFWGKLYGIPLKELKQKIITILNLIGLLDRKDDLIKTFSGGMKRRINIAAAILHNPKILFMDEPTAGVDPQSRNRIFEIVQALNKQGMTIVYTTHYMEEVERLCNKIAIIDEGTIIAQGTLIKLQKESSIEEKIEIQFKSISKTQFKPFKEKFPSSILKKSTISIACDVQKELVTLIGYCNNLSLIIEDVQIKKVNLEAIFLSLTGKQLRD